MKRNRILLATAILACILMSTVAAARFMEIDATEDVDGAVEVEVVEEATPSRLAVVWTSGDPDVAHKMTFMYVHASEKSGWFDENLVIVWGPSSKLLYEDEAIQEKVKAMMADGVRFQACQACADMYGVSPKLRELGIEVKYMGRPLTEMLQDDGWEVMTF